MTNMIPIYSLLTTATLNSRLASQKRKFNKLLTEDRIREKDEILEALFDLAHEEIEALVDISKSKNNDSDVEFDSEEFDKNGNLLIKRSGWKSMADQEQTVELFSPETGEMFFSHRRYTSVSGDMNTFEHYTKGVCDTDKCVENILNERKRVQLETKRDAHREKIKSRMLKFKRFLGLDR